MSQSETPPGDPQPEASENVEPSGIQVQVPAAGGGEMRDLVVHSLLASLCPLIPIPLVDDWILDRIRRRLAQRLAATHGVVLTDEVLALLADREISDWSAKGCVSGCFDRTVLWPIRFVYSKLLRKIFRKILFVLAIKDGVDEFSRTFHDAWLVRHALTTGHVDSDEGQMREVRRAIDAVRKELDPRPVESTVRSIYQHSRKLLRRTFALLSRLGRKAARSPKQTDKDLSWVDRAAADTEEEAGGLVDELIAGLGRQRSYLRSIEARLDRRLDRRFDHGLASPTTTQPEDPR